MPAALPAEDAMNVEALDGYLAGLLLTPDFRYVEVDAVGLQIWDAIAGGASVGEVADALTEGFDVNPARARQDVSDFLGQLADLGLVVSCPEPGED